MKMRVGLLEFQRNKTFTLSKVNTPMLPVAKLDGFLLTTLKSKYKFKKNGKTL